MGVVLETKSMCKGQRKLGTVQTGHREVNLDLMRAQIGRVGLGEVKMVTLRKNTKR